MKQWNDVDAFGLSIAHNASGFFIGTMTENGPCHRAGLQRGDKIIEVNGSNVENETHQQVLTQLRGSAGRFQLLVADQVTCEYYRSRDIVMSSTMQDLNVVTPTRKPYKWGDVGQLLDTRVNAYMASTTPRMKYMVELLLRVPLMYFIHLFFMLSPSSNYILVEFVLCLFRYVGAFLLLGCWGQSVNTLFTIYTRTAPSMFIAWMMEKVYWTFQNTAKGVCHDVWLPWEQDTWWTPVIFTCVLQVAHLLYLLKKFRKDGALIVVIGVLLVPYTFSSIDICLYYLADIQYWFSKVIFCACLFGEIASSYDNKQYCDRNGRFQLPQLPGTWFMRDVLALFGVFYFFFCVLFDLLFIYNISYVFSMAYLSSCIGMWCTSFAVVSAVGALGALIANAAAALSLKLIRGESNFSALMNSSIGSRVNITMTTYCLEAGILSVYEEARISNMESVLFLSLFVIFLQSWNITEAQFLSVINSGEGNRLLAFLRVLFFSVILLTMPTLITVYVSPKIGVDVWLMLHLSGNAMMLSRAVVVFVEILLVSCTWYVDNGLERLEELIYLTRVSKTAVLVICAIANAYYRFYAPFFDTWWVVRAIIIILDIIVVTYTLCKKEWDVFQARHKLINLVSRLPDASVDELTENDDVCSVCYDAMTSAKKLPCSHIFHGQCLRKWFQVKPTCPYCNANVL